MFLQRNEAKMLEDLHRLKQEKQALEVDLQLMKKERDLAKAQAVSTSGTTEHRADLSVPRVFSHGAPSFYLHDK